VRLHSIVGDEDANEAVMTVDVMPTEARRNGDIERGDADVNRGASRWPRDCSQRRRCAPACGEPHEHNESADSLNNRHLRGIGSKTYSLDWASARWDARAALACWPG